MKIYVVIVRSGTWDSIEEKIDTAYYYKAHAEEYATKLNALFNRKKSNECEAYTEEVIVHGHNRGGDKKLNEWFNKLGLRKKPDYLLDKFGN